MKKEEIQYIPPLLTFIEMAEVTEKIGPVLSCSGYGGTVTGC